MHTYTNYRNGDLHNYKYIGTHPAYLHACTTQKFFENISEIFMGYIFFALYANIPFHI